MSLGAWAGETNGHGACLLGVGISRATLLSVPGSPAQHGGVPGTHYKGHSLSIGHMYQTAPLPARVSVCPELLASPLLPLPLRVTPQSSRSAPYPGTQPWPSCPAVRLRRGRREQEPRTPSVGRGVALDYGHITCTVP